LRDGDIVQIDARSPALKLSVELVADVLAQRAAEAGLRAKSRQLGGVLGKYAAVVGSAHQGAVTHAGVPLDELADGAPLSSGKAIK
jgi:dihydroxy-acid dehydratase